MVTPDRDTREEVADKISAHPDAELVTFTRDVYQTMYVNVDTDDAREELIELGEEAGYDVTSGPDGRKLTFEAQNGGPREVR